MIISSIVHLNYSIICISILIMQISPDHCNCTEPARNNCVTIDDLSETLNLTNFPDSCSSAAYVSNNLYDELYWMSDIEEFSTDLVSLVYRSNCNTWRAEYIQENSPANTVANLACSNLSG